MSNSKIEVKQVENEVFQEVKVEEVEDKKEEKNNNNLIDEIEIYLKDVIE